MEVAEKARRAQAIFEDPVFVDVFAALEAQYTASWRSTQPAEIQKRETAWASLRALDDIRGKIQSVMNAPKVDAHNNRNAAKR